ncbi:MAG: SDR family oxidoreductase [Bacteroidetes bacterium]|nr:SDR family oxidoreductase [Bacteroidota bacterium]
MKNKVVIITGASSGIGNALAQNFIRMGENVVMAARDIVKLKEMEIGLHIDQKKILSVKTDVSNESDCRNLIKKTIEKFGTIDILINNAGISMRAIVEEVDLSVLKRVMDVNFWGTVYCTKFALPWLIASKGTVVGVSSIAGYKGLPGRSGYSASKFAVQGFLEVLRIENMKKGLHVLIACPGFTASNIRTNALAADGSQQGESPRNEKKMMTPDKVAERIIEGIRRKKHRIILTTQGNITVTLNKFFPKTVDKLVFNHLAKEHDSPIKSTNHPAVLDI